jgi:hypothetical protein
VSDLQALLFFVQMKGFGSCDEKKRAVYSLEMSSSKIVAEPDKPLALVVAILERWQDHWKYSSVEAAKADLERLKKFVDGIEITED